MADKNPFYDLIKRNDYKTIKNWKLFIRGNRIIVEKYNSVDVSISEFEIEMVKYWFDGPNETWYFINNIGSLFKIAYSDRVKIFTENLGNIHNYISNLQN